jgi:hypothetical protein
VRLPNAEQAIIEPRKLHGYLLSTSHPIGRFKARFFAALGYSAQDWQVFEADLRAQHLSADAEVSDTLSDGQLFTIRAILNGRNGQSAAVLSVWFVPTVGGVPRFVTAYPGGSQ